MSETKKTSRKSKQEKASASAELPPADSAMESDAGHIDKIRDIIFGRQMSDYEARFATIEKRINNQIDRLRKYADENFKSLTNQLQDLHDKLSERLQTEQAERGREDAAISKALKALSDQQRQDVQMLSDRLLEISGQFSDELHIQQVEAAKDLENAIREMDEIKLARTTLSQMLTEMADKLTETQN